MLRRLLTLLTVLTLACASAKAYVPERSLLHQSELASPAKTAPRGFAARAEPAAKEKSAASDCCVRENWHPPLKLASSMQFTGHYREREGSSYYAQQRYYRPGVGRFNRVDPWEGNELSPITLNKYLYANGNPLVFVDPDGRASRWASEDEIPHGANYWAINRGGRVQYWNTSADAYSDANNYQIARGMASAFGASAQTMERGMLDRVSRWATGADAEPVPASAAAAPLQVVESGGPQGVGLTDPNWEMARLAQLRSGLTSGVEGVKQGAEIAQEVGCGLSVACSLHSATTGRDQSGNQLSGVERGLAAAPVGLALLKVGGDLVSTVRSTMRMGDGFVDAGMADDLAAMTRGAGRVPDALPHNPGPRPPLGVGDPAQRYQGPWTQRDLERAAQGMGPLDLVPRVNRRGREVPLEIHHADQMPGSAIHEVNHVEHRRPGVHGQASQGVTDRMRREDAQLHWQLRGQEMGNLPPPHE